MNKLIALTVLLAASTAGLVLADEGAVAPGMMMDQQSMGGHTMTQDTDSRGTRGHGVIKSVDAQNASVNITHDPIPALQWPAMTMDLPVAEQVDLSGVKAGDTVDFTILLGSDNVYRVTEMAPAQ
jgi:Cu(I)/Ag(I) efflux system protein CusF